MLLFLVLCVILLEFHRGAQLNQGSFIFNYSLHQGNRIDTGSLDGLHKCFTQRYNRSYNGIPKDLSMGKISLRSSSIVPKLQDTKPESEFNMLIPMLRSSSPSNSDLEDMQ